MSRRPSFCVRLAWTLVLAIIGTLCASPLAAQPLLREAPETKEPQPEEMPPVDAAPRGGRMTPEEQQQQNWERMMEFNRDQMLKQAEERASGERMMRYALWTAIGVIGLTMLVAYARNRAETPPGPIPGAGQGRGAPPAIPPSQPASGDGNLNRD